MKLRIWPIKYRKYIHKPRAKSGDGWYYYKKRIKMIWPIYYFFKHKMIFRYPFNRYGFNDAKWWIKHRTTHRNHNIKTGLKPGWHDFDNVVLHGAFERFAMEYPHTRKAIILDKKVEKELDELLDWWQNKRPDEYKKIDELSEMSIDQMNLAFAEARAEGRFISNKISNQKAHDEFIRLSKEMMDLENELYDKDTKNLIRLIKLRSHVAW